MENEKKTGKKEKRSEKVEKQKECKTAKNMGKNKNYEKKNKKIGGIDDKDMKKDGQKRTNWEKVREIEKK